MVSTNLKRAALALLLSALGGYGARAQDETGNTIIFKAQAGGGAAAAISSAPGLNVMPWTTNLQTPAPFWIGVECQPLDQAMRKALQLTDETGVLVVRVSAESPASKAGLQVGDILQRWRVGEQAAQPINDTENLVKLVQELAAQQPGQAATLEIMRGGEKKELTIQPAKRELGDQVPAGGAQAQAAEAVQKLQQQWALDSARTGLESRLAEARGKLEEAKARYEGFKARAEAAREGFESGTAKKSDVAQAEAEIKIAEAQIRQAEAQYQHAQAHAQQYQAWAKAMQAHGFQLPGQGNANFDVLIPAPGIVTKAAPLQAQAFVQGHAQMKAPEWPENLSVTMKRTGNKPAEFTIERGEEKWQVTSETLKDLPPEVRVLVEPLAEPQRPRMMRLWSSSSDEMPGRVELRLPEGDRPPQPGLPIAPPRVVIHANPQLQPNQVPPATQKQIDDLQKALEQLRKQVEKMEK